MFCFQCEQTAGGVACQGAAGVCGKSAAVSDLQDDLTGALIGLARAVKENESARTNETDQMLMSALFSTITNVDFDADNLDQQVARIQGEKQRILKEAQKTEEIAPDEDLQTLWTSDEDIRSLKSLILFGLRGMAAYDHHARRLGYIDTETSAFYYKALEAIGNPEKTAQELVKLALEVGSVNYEVMKRLDEAHTSVFGHPEPCSVTMTVEKGPFIVISGHDLLDLKQLLEQTEGKGINIYTHGEMLPAHGYPELSKFKHLKGNFKTAWQNQQKEFKDIPAPILFTTNCLMPPKADYADRVFTTDVVAFPGLQHIDENKDFTPVIEKALELGGYKEDQHFTGINGGHQVKTGFAHNALLSQAPALIEAISKGEINHVFLVAGCDGAKTGRSYYTEFVKATPKDSLVLTLACGKYRFNDLDLGTAGGFDRLMDMGQCNDAFSAIALVVGLSEALNCPINELPISIVLSWYEQKAVSVLLTLLSLGMTNILLGPSIPAFLSKGVLNDFVSQGLLAPTTIPQNDLEKLLRK